MAAVIEIEQVTGDDGSPVETLQTGLKLRGSDSPSATSPMLKPLAGTYYSYELWFRFKCTTAPVASCTGFKIWTSGGPLPTGINITINSDAVSVYVTPSNSKSVAGSRADITDYTSVAKLDVAGTLINEDDVTDFLVIQGEVDNTVTPGPNSSLITVNYQYDEA